MTLASTAMVLALLGACTRANTAPPPPAPQNPSPMVELTREHQRLDSIAPDGKQFTITGLLSRPIVVFVPKGATGAEATLLVHFNGAPYVAMHAAADQRSPIVLAAIHLGAGSAVYERAFAASGTLQRIKAAIADSLAVRFGSDLRLSRTVLSGFSAGYGAIRAILGWREDAASVYGLLLLDGLHVSYIPDRTPVANGGAIDTARLAPFVDYARAAATGPAAGRMVVTHSEIFPGTFASTTETADHLLARLGLRRTPVLEWGPGGMQLLSTVRAGNFLLLGFAGNTAPDHVDHYHGMGAFLQLLLPSDDTR
ncbi:MAG TPA: hypothetical protein VMM77_04540 [Gemmatimonadaceae bacterium]|nr:hypothetical protein [Gemmatimonadaceae bacterium]